MGRAGGDKMRMGRWWRGQGRKTREWRWGFHCWHWRWTRKQHRPLHGQVVDWDTLKAFLKIA